MNRSRLDMNTARERTPTMAVTWRGLSGTPSGAPPGRAAIVEGRELTGASSSQSVRNLDSPYPARTQCVQIVDALGMMGNMAAVASQPRACSVARTLEIVGEKWALLAV